MGTKALASNGMTVEEAVIGMHSGSPGPILGPSHDGAWLILRCRNGLVIRWACDVPCCPAHPVSGWDEVKREAGNATWLEAPPGMTVESMAAALSAPDADMAELAGLAEMVQDFLATVPE